MLRLLREYRLPNSKTAIGTAQLLLQWYFVPLVLIKTVLSDSVRMNTVSPLKKFHKDIFFLMTSLHIYLPKRNCGNFLMPTSASNTPPIPSIAVLVSTIVGALILSPISFPVTTIVVFVHFFLLPESFVLVAGT
jgi:hypothetical protein